MNFMAAKTPWTETVEIRLSELWAEGLSAAKCAAALNEQFNLRFTRNAIIGKAHRENFPLRGRPIAKPKPPRKPRVYAFKPPRPVIAPPEVIDQQIPIEQRTTLLQLDALRCHWPVGDPQDSNFFFCGGIAHENSPYCLAHSIRAYDPNGRGSRYGAYKERAR